MADRAFLEGPRGDGTFKWCVFPCQQAGAIKARADGTPWNPANCRVPIYPQQGGDGHTWRAEGPPEAPTLTPSINCQNGTCWHGFIVNGEVRNPRTAI